MRRALICVTLAGSLGMSNQADRPFDQTKTLAQLRQQIAGKEQLPAEEVFRNIQDYKGVPAASLLRGMEFYGRVLGVTCTHCHVADQWERDDKPAKQITREMSAMVDTITSTLRKMRNLPSERPGVPCATCHRGQLKPATAESVVDRPESVVGRSGLQTGTRRRPEDHGGLRTAS